MPPRNIIHSARTLHDLLNLFLFVCHDLLNLFLFTETTFTKLCTQSHLCRSALDISLQFSKQSHHNVRVPSDWIDAAGSRRRILQLFSAIHHDLLAPIFLGNPSRSSCANFLGNASQCSCANFSRPSITLTRRHSVRTVTHINSGGCVVGVEERTEMAGGVGGSGT